MRKVGLYIPAYGGCSIELEVPEDMSDEAIKDLAYQKASLSDGELYVWDYEAEIEIVDME